MAVRKKRIGRRSRKRGGVRARRFKKGGISSTKVPRMLTADNLMVRLKYFDPSTIRNNAGSPVLSFRFQSSAYDIDPLLATAAIPGFTEYSSFYNEYFVPAMSLKTEMVNAESFPVVASYAPSLTDVGANYSTANMADWPYSKSVILGPATGQCRGRLSGYMTARKMLGNKRPDYDPNWQAAVTANPAGMFRLNVQAASMNGVSNFTANNGLQLRTVITLYVMFFGRKIINA